MISLYLMVSKCPTLPVLGLLWSSSIRTRFLYPSGVVSRHWQLPRQALSTAYPLQTLHHLHLAGFLWFLLFVLWGFMGDLVCKAVSGHTWFVPHRISFQIAMGPTICIILTPPKYQGGSTRLPAAVCLGDRIVWEERMSHVYWPPLHRWLATCIPCTRPSEPVA